MIDFFAPVVAAASTALNITLFVATGNLVSLGVAIFCGCLLVLSLRIAGRSR